MVIWSKLRALIAVALSACLLCPPALALVTYNDGKEHVFVTGTVTLTHDSNIYAHAGGGGDTIYGAGVLVEYARKAGWIGVNANLALDLSRFVEHSDQNFLNPRLSAEFTKSTGRTTGAISLSAARESQADSATNLREESWNYNATVNFKYPVNDRYSFSGALGYGDQQFQDNSLLSNLRTYTFNTDLLYALSSDRDLMAGYRYRYTDTSRDSAYDDQSFTIGLSGKIIPRLTGVLRAGYQVRDPRRRATDGGYRGWTASASTTFTATKRFSVTGDLSKDVSVTSTNLSIDTLSGGLSAQYVFNARFSVNANVGGGQSKFLGAASLNREDEYFTFGAGVNYTLDTHLKASLGYSYFENWSTLAYADYIRNSFNLTLSSRW